MSCCLPPRGSPMCASADAACLSLSHALVDTAGIIRHAERESVLLSLLRVPAYPPWLHVQPPTNFTNWNVSLCFLVALPVFLRSSWFMHVRLPLDSAYHRLRPLLTPPAISLSLPESPHLLLYPLIRSLPRFSIQYSSSCPKSGERSINMLSLVGFIP